MFSENLNVDKIGNLKSKSISELDSMIKDSEYAEQLLSDKNFGRFMRDVELDLTKELISVAGHTDTDNNKRISLTNQLVGINKLVEKLQRAAKAKKTAVNERDNRSSRI